jgi:colicin import membrane protein
MEQLRGCLCHARIVGPPCSAATWSSGQGACKEAERIAKDKAERLVKEKAEVARKEAECIAKEKAEAARKEAEHIAKEKAVRLAQDEAAAKAERMAD